MKEENKLEGNEDGRGHNGESMIRQVPDIRTEQYHAQMHNGTDYKGKDSSSKSAANKEFIPETGWSRTLD